MTTAPSVIVVGSGIVGAAIAWHLAAGGAEVTVLEAGERGGVATPCSFAWINAARGNPEPYYRLRIRSMTEWRRLADAVPGIPLSWCGGLTWDMNEAEREVYFAEQGRRGYALRLVDRAEIARIEPALADPPAVALHAAGEGAVEPRVAALALLDDAVRRGARLRVGVAVAGLARRGDAVTGAETVEGSLAADHVVLAAGTATARLAASVDVNVPLLHSPGLIAHSQPLSRRLLNGLVMAPGLHMRQTMDGRIDAATDFSGSDPGTDPAGVARAVLARAAAMLKGVGDLALDFHTVGFRPLPADRFPAVGPAAGIAGLTIAVTHSGITLAPVIGRLVAEELLRGRRDPLLAPYGVDRFATARPA